MCPSLWNITLGGHASQKKESWLDILVNECDNSTSKIPCKPKAEIKNFLLNKHFIVYSLDNYVDIDNFEKPIKPMSSYFVKYMSYDIYQGVEKLFQILSVKTDAGLVFNSIEEEKSLISKEEINNFSVYP